MSNPQHIKATTLPLLASRKQSCSRRFASWASRLYAYSPLAGGFLTKTKEDIEAGAGRFNKEALGGMYAEMYVIFFFGYQTIP